MAGCPGQTHLAPFQPPSPYALPLCEFPTPSTRCFSALGISVFPGNPLASPCWDVSLLLSLAECPGYELSRSTALGGGFECFGLPAALASQHPMPLGQLAQPLPGRTAGKANGWARLRQGRLKEGLFDEDQRECGAFRYGKLESACFSILPWCTNNTKCTAGLFFS